MIQNVATLQASTSVNPTRMSEAPLMPTVLTPFTRTVAPLSNGAEIIALTTSGFTVLPWNYAAAVESLNQVLTADPVNELALRLRAQSYIKLKRLRGDFDAADRRVKMKRDFPL